MRVTNITVTAGRVFNHPYEQFSNLRPEVVLTASLDEGEDSEGATRLLQGKAEKLVEDHKQGLLSSIRELYHLSQRQREVRDLESELQRAQSRLEAIRKENPELTLISDGREV